MALIVSVFCASHAPLMTAAPATAPDAQRTAFFGALTTAAGRVIRARADAVVVVSNEHFTNFFLDNMPSFCLGTSDRHWGTAEQWVRLPQAAIPGHAGLAGEIASALMSHGVDLATSRELELDHGVMTIYHAIDPTYTTPLIPLIQNCNVAPMPTLRRCYQFGVLLRQSLDAARSAQRVAVVGTGGLSHSIGTPAVGEIDEDFDRWFLDRFSTGRLEEIFDLDDDELGRAGNGAHEIRSWLTMAGLTGSPPEIMCYEPIREWITGMAVAAYGEPFTAQDRRGRRPVRATQPAGDLRERNSR